MELEGSSVNLEGSRIVPLMRVEDKIEADRIIELLEANGVSAVWRVPQSPPLDGLEITWLGKHFGEILVLDRNLEKAKEIVGSE